MEDVARLAVIEQTVRDIEVFNKVLQDLLQQIHHILENPHDLKHRTLKTLHLKSALEHDVFRDYLKYIGFETAQGEYTFPKEKTLQKLQMAKAAIERKISICYGTKQKLLISKPLKNFLLENKPNLKPVNLRTNNDFVRRIQGLFNDVLKYEDEELQAEAREQIPLIELQVKAIERVQNHQKQLKLGEVKGEDLSYEIALLMELMGWFRYQFFSWVDAPTCEKCGESTVHYKNDIMKTETETCRVEIYRCTTSDAEDHGARFPRHNDPATLLRTRRGRCGEWANCFALLCRAMGYDTRYVYDTTDHVWCEVYDQANSKWLHVDPCECTLDAPLTYCCGWGKKIAYVIAVSRDDVQDVTWRYTTKHHEVLKRRVLCEEWDLISALMSLRATRQVLVSEHRRRYLAKRCLKELVQLMVEREAGDSENGGRISGAAQWRRARNEISTACHTFKYDKIGRYVIYYCCAKDRYDLFAHDEYDKSINGFQNGCYTMKSIIRKVENDWGQVYLAREESEEEGTISWCLSIGKAGLCFEHMSVFATWACYGGGVVTLTAQVDSAEPALLDPYSGTRATWHFHEKFNKVILRAHLAGGSGDVAWQHAQLFRQSANHLEPAMRIETNVIDLSTTGDGLYTKKEMNLIGRSNGNI